MMSCGRLCDPETAAEKKACNTTGRKTFLILYEYMCRRSQRGVKRDEWVGGLDFNGCGTSGWNWDIGFILIHCAPRSLLLLVRWRKRRLSTPPLPYQDMDRQMWPCPGNKDASLVATLPSSRMGRCAVLLGRRFVRTSGARKAMEACAWCMRPASTVAAPVLCASSVNGMAKPLANLA